MKTKVCPDCGKRYKLPKYADAASERKCFTCQVVDKTIWDMLQLPMFAKMTEDELKRLSEQAKKQYREENQRAYKERIAK